MRLKTLALSLFGGLALAYLALFLVSEWRGRVTERAYPPEGQFVEIEGLRIHAVVMGDGPDLVLLHGSNGSTRDYTFGLADRLKETYRLIILDRPGLGWSDALPQGSASIHDQARVLRKATAQLGAARPIVLGQSYGGAVALAWAVDAPDSISAVVNLAGPSHPWDTPLPGFYQLTSSPWTRWLAVPLIAAIWRNDQIDASLIEVFAPQPVPEGYRDGFGVALSLTRSRIAANAEHRASLKSEITAMASDYPDLKVPIEIVHGDADTTVSVKIHAKRLIQDTGQAKLTVLNGIGHMPQHVAHDAVVAAIDRAAARAGF